MDDKESFINNHEKAPLIELDDFYCPLGSNSFYFRTYDDKKIRKGFILWYKRSQLLNLDEEFKYKDTASLKKISSSIGLKTHPKSRSKLIYKMKEKIMQKNWKSIDKLYKKIKRK